MLTEPNEHTALLVNDGDGPATAGAATAPTAVPIAPGTSRNASRNATPIGTPVVTTSDAASARMAMSVNGSGVVSVTSSARRDETGLL